jgi:murein DD-endopeptidase MepM/ murein hydrolase activator NlpD
MNRLLLGAALALSACPKDEPAPVAPAAEAKLGAQRCSGQPGRGNQRLPVLQRPFDGQYPVGTVFDHDLPRETLRALTAGDRELSYCGKDLLGLPDGASGYTFAMPLGTPILAAADGEVSFAGVVSAFSCPALRRAVDDQLMVEVRHDALGEVGFITRSSHLSRVLVKVGDHVVKGQRLGLSGQSGCATGPVFGFETRRLSGTPSGTPTVVDPYGWDGPGPDPWAQAPQGAESLYLWQDGEAPTLKSR